MFNRPPWVSLALALTLLILAGRAQQPPQPPDQTPSGAAPAPAQDESQPPIFRSGINFIRVDVIVTDDDGNPVTDLEVGDFEVFEDGEPQTIESFQLIEISAVPAPGAEPPRSVSNRHDEEREAARTDTRVFVIFFDDYHVRYENGVRAGQTLVQFLENNLVPTDLVGIMYPLTPLIDVQLTRNHAAIIRAVDNFLGRKVRLPASQRVRAALRPLPDRNRRATTQRRLALGAQGANDSPGWVGRRPEERAAAERGVHELRASRAARAQRHPRSVAS